jgi:membrane protease YdiL (CAAX protease family)
LNFRMTRNRVFFAPTGTLRAPWRLLIFVVAVPACTFVTAVIVGTLINKAFDLLGLSPVSSNNWVSPIGMLAATALMLRFVEHRSWSAIWMGRDAARPALLAEWFLIGALAIGVPIVLLLGAHWLTRAPGTGGASWAGAALRVSLFLLPAALSEELFIRGYIFTVLRESWGWKWTMAVTSVAFGLGHLGNDNVDVASIALVMLAGVFLGGVLVATKSLYAAWMAHFAWNWTMAVLFHTAVSGYPMEAPGYRYLDAGPDWATGGAWGPEGGIPAGLGMIGAVGLAFIFARRRGMARREENTRG